MTNLTSLGKFNSSVSAEKVSAFKPQLAVAWEKSLHDLKYPVIAEPKLDGVRCVCIIKDGEISFWSRDGKPFVNFEELANEIENSDLDDFILDGEIIATSGKFDDTISRARSHRGKNTHIDYVFNVFDVITGYGEPLLERKRILGELEAFHFSAIPHIRMVSWLLIDDSLKLQAYHLENCNNGYEGTMVKPLDSKYHNGRNKDWKKIKPFLSADIQVQHILEGQGKQAGMMGALICAGHLEDKTYIQCKVGTGFDDDLRQEIWNNQEKYLNKYIEVQYQEVTKLRGKTMSHSLRFPSFKRFRMDKD